MAEQARRPVALPSFVKNENGELVRKRPQLARPPKVSNSCELAGAEIPLEKSKKTRANVKYG
jgi:hypothetical protein